MPCPTVIPALPATDSSKFKVGDLARVKYCTSGRYSQKVVQILEVMLYPSTAYRVRIANSTALWYLETELESPGEIKVGDRVKILPSDYRPTTEIAEVMALYATPHVLVKILSNNSQVAYQVVYSISELQLVAFDTPNDILGQESTMYLVNSTKFKLGDLVTIKVNSNKSSYKIIQIYTSPINTITSYKLGTNDGEPLLPNISFGWYYENQLDPWIAPPKEIPDPIKYSMSILKEELNTLRNERDQFRLKAEELTTKVSDLYYKIDSNFQFQKELQEKLLAANKLTDDFRAHARVSEGLLHLTEFEVEKLKNPKKFKSYQPNRLQQGIKLGANAVSQMSNGCLFILQFCCLTLPWKIINKINIKGHHFLAASRQFRRWLNESDPVLLGFLVFVTFLICSMVDVCYIDTVWLMPEFQAANVAPPWHIPSPNEPREAALIEKKQRLLASQTQKMLESLQINQTKESH